MLFKRNVLDSENTIFIDILEKKNCNILEEIKVYLPIFTWELMLVYILELQSALEKPGLQA